LLLSYTYSGCPVSARALPKGEWLCFLFDAGKGTGEEGFFWEGIGENLHNQI
jgi:hypothetical protein